ncbi:MAG: PAS domain S-box protein [Nitrospinae bacterium]|nr:PAS domain S-box protein [Nitrospinota bacterium]
MILESKFHISLAGSASVLSVSDNIDELIGFKKDDFLKGKISLESRIHPHDRDISDELFSNEIKQASGSYNFRLRHADGQICCIRGEYNKWTDKGSKNVILELRLQDSKSLWQQKSDREILPNFKSMMENTNDYIYFKDRNHVFTGASQTLVSLTEPSTHWTDLLGKTDYDVFPENYADIYYRLEKQVFSGIDVAHEIQETMDNDGNKGWVDNRKFPIRDDHNKIIGLFGIARIITDQKIAEEKLRLSEKRFRTVFEEAPLGVALIDSLTGVIYEANPRFAEIAGRTKEEMATIDWMSITHPDDVQEDLDNMADLNAGKTTGFNMNKRYIKPDGSHVWINMTIAPITVEDKTKPRHLCMIEDITQRKAFENELETYRKNLKKLVDYRTNELKESLLRFKTYFELPLIGVAITSPQKGWIEVNQKLCDILGYNQEELFNLDWVELTHPDDVASDLDQFDKVASGETEGYSIRKRFIRKDKVVVFVELSARCVRKSNGDIDYFVTLINDISEQVEIEKRVKETQAQLAHADKLSSLGKLVGSVAHEFNNPLFGVMNLVDQLADDDFADQKTELSRVAKNECQRMAGMIKNLQSFYKPSEGIETDIKISNLTEDVLLIIGKDIKQKGIKIVRNFSESETTIKSVEDQIKQVVINLLQNASDSISGSDGEISLTIESDNSNMILKVQDNGKGIPKEDIGKLFEPFFTTKGIKGTGLGLSVSYGIVKKHGGEIAVESEVGKGSIFSLILPVAGNNK